MTLKDVKVEDGRKYTTTISLVKLTEGKEIADIHGTLDTEFGTPTFKMRSIIFKDGTELLVEGEHDYPYITGLDDKLLDELYEEERTER